MFLNDSPCKRDLKGLVGGNVGGELGERLLTTASDSDEEGVAFRHADYARDLDKVHDGVLEEDKVHAGAADYFVVLGGEHLQALFEDFHALDLEVKIDCSRNRFSFN